MSARLAMAAAMAAMSLARLRKVSTCSTMLSCRSGVIGPAGAVDRTEHAAPMRDAAFCAVLQNAHRAAEQAKDFCSTERMRYFGRTARKTEGDR